MKIGILTYHRAHNYGALLQAIALRKVLLNYGHEVWYIDYWPEYHQKMYAHAASGNVQAIIQGGFKRVLSFLAYSLLAKKRYERRYSLFDSFIKENIIPFCKDYSSSNKYDIIIYGSDQIWRRQTELSWKFDRVYFGDNILWADRHIAYAASMGEIILSEDDKAFLIKNLERFSKIYVREDDLNEILKDLGLKCATVLDPVFLLSPQEWERYFIIKKLYKERYVLYYRLMRDSFDEQRIRLFASKNNLKLIVLDGSVRRNNRNALTAIKPEEFISLIKYAEFVFTSSYHGLVFSLIYNKQFFASFVRNKARAESLLNKVGLGSRLLEPGGTFPLSPDYIYYDNCNEITARLKEYSLNALLQAI